MTLDSIIIITICMTQLRMNFCNCIIGRSLLVARYHNCSYLVCPYYGIANHVRIWSCIAKQT